MPVYTSSRSPFRVIAQDILTREFIDFHVPLIDVEVTYTNSGANELSGRFDPEIPRVDLPTFDAWRTLLHVEQGGDIDVSGILSPYSIDEVSLEVVCSGFSAYPHGIAYVGNYSRVGVDPMDVVREIWNHLQAWQPNGGLQVQVDNTTSPIRVGTPNEDGILQAAQLILDHIQSGGRIYEDFSYDGNPEIVSNSNDVIATEFYQGDYGGFTLANFEAFLIEFIDESVAITGTGPYTLQWWNSPDCGAEIDKLASSTPFDYWEESSWNADKSDIDLRLRLAYPRRGTQRTNLRFAAHENIIAPVPRTELEDFYANVVQVLGAGEGRDRVRASMAYHSPDRLRRMATVTDKNIVSAWEARARARDELERRQHLVSMEEIEIDTMDPNAEHGEFEPGDDIPVTSDFPYYGRQTILHRITQYTWRPNHDRGILKLRPSGSYRYGPHDTT